jgi:hypothetical protein
MRGVARAPAETVCAAAASLGSNPVEANPAPGARVISGEATSLRFDGRSFVALAEVESLFIHCSGVSIVTAGSAPLT